MSKFHINKNGVSAPCRATKGNCPLGGEGQHFNSEEEAQAFITNQMEKEHGLLGETSVPEVENPNENFRGAPVIFKDDKNILTEGLNKQDTNFHLYSKDGTEYLIDVDDMPYPIPNDWTELKNLAWMEGRD